MRLPRSSSILRFGIGTAFGLLVLQFISPGGYIPGEQVDLGVVPRGTVIQHTFELANAGLRDLTVRGVEPSCGVRATVPPDTVVERGSRRRFAVTVDTVGAPEGPRASTLVLRTKDPVPSTLRLTLKYRVQSEFTLSSAYISLSADRTSTGVDFDPAQGSGVHVTGVQSTDPRVRATFAQTSEGTRITALTVPEHARSWDLGLLLVRTSSKAYPEIRIPVRGSLGAADLP